MYIVELKKLNKVVERGSTINSYEIYVDIATLDPNPLDHNFRHLREDPYHIVVVRHRVRCHIPEVESNDCRTDVNEARHDVYALSRLLSQNSKARHLTVIRPLRGFASGTRKVPMNHIITA